MQGSVRSIPVVDLGNSTDGDDAEIMRVADEVARALEEVGFFYLVGHGLDWSLVEEVRRQAFRLFSLPREEKLATPGYLEVGELYYPEPGAPPAKNESWSMPRVDRPDGWPSQAGFRTAILAYRAAARQLAEFMLLPIARALEVPDTFFTERFTEPTASVRLRYYPVCTYEENQWGLGAHCDQDFLTFLPDNEVAGLAVRVSAEEWIEAPSVPGSFLVNSGTVMRRWTNDRFRAAEHRVLNLAGVDRVALPMFYSPDSGTKVAPLPSCVTSENPARYETLVIDRSANPRPRAHVNFPGSGLRTPDALSEP